MSDVSCSNRVVLGLGNRSRALIASNVSSRRRPEPLKTFLGRGIFWVELDRLVVIGHRPVVVALGLKGAAAVVVGEGKFRVELDNRGAAVDCPIPVLSLHAVFISVRSERCRYGGSCLLCHLLARSAKLSGKVFQLRNAFLCLLGLCQLVHKVGASSGIIE